MPFYSDRNPNSQAMYPTLDIWELGWIGGLYESREWIIRVCSELIQTNLSAAADLAPLKSSQKFQCALGKESIIGIYKSVVRASSK
jgi:hypothetical protein